SDQIYCTFIGGDDDDKGMSIAIDPSGNAFVAGETKDGSTDYPTTTGPYSTHNGSEDVFVTKLNAAGSALTYSMLIGGSGADYGTSIAIDAPGNAFVTGYTEDSLTDYPTTPGAYDTTHNGYYDAFVTKVNPTGAGLTYSTYLGGSGYDTVERIAVDALGNAFITGYTADVTTQFPTTAGAYDTTHNGGYDVFVSKLSSLGSTLMYSTFIGDGSNDGGHGIDLDASGNVFVTGNTARAAVGFPTTPEVFHPENNGLAFDVFVTKFGDYSISGRTVDHLGNALPSSAVALSGDGDGFMLSDSEGYFGFSDTFLGGTYLVSATHLLNNFNPPNYSIQSLNRNKRVTFVGRTITSGPSAALRQLGGAVHSSASGVGLPFTQMSLVDIFGNIRTTQTDANGRYVFDNVETG